LQRVSRMSYRIYLDILKKKEYDNLVTKRIAQKIAEEDDNLLCNLRGLEIHDETQIDQFEKMPGYEDTEYPPYILQKSDLQIILDHYKVFLHKEYNRMEDVLDKMKTKDNFNPREMSSIAIHFVYLKGYFERLIFQKKNVDDCGMFLLDYFKLVNMFENMKDDEIGIITHG